MLVLVLEELYDSNLCVGLLQFRKQWVLMMESGDQPEGWDSDAYKLEVWDAATPTQRTSCVQIFHGGWIIDCLNHS